MNGCFKSYFPSRRTVSAFIGALWLFNDVGTAKAGINVWTSRGPSEGFVTTLTVDPTGTVYAGTSDGVFRTTDGGRTWLSVGLTGMLIQALGVDPLTADTLYAGTTNLFRSADHGGKWVAITADVHFPLAIDPISPSTLYAGTPGAIHRSVDSGSTWTDIFTLPPGCTSNELTVDPQTTSTLYAVTTCGVFRSTDGGENWDPASEGLGGYAVLTMAIDPEVPSILYAGTYAGGLFQSTDRALSWNAINVGLPSSSIVPSIVIDPGTPSTIYVSTAFGLYKSTDRGVFWGPLNTGLPDDFLSWLVVDPTTRPITVYAATFGRGVFTIQEGAVCDGDCNGLQLVTLPDLITLVNIALGTQEPGSCPNGLPIGGNVDIAVILRAVNHALMLCPPDVTKRAV